MRTKISTPQTQTAHITRHRDGKRYRVWAGLDQVGASDSLTTARRRAAHTNCQELTECWETGKAFERSKRGTWKQVKNTD